MFSAVLRVFAALLACAVIGHCDGARTAAILGQATLSHGRLSRIAALMMPTML